MDFFIYLKAALKTPLARGSLIGLLMVLNLLGPIVPVFIDVPEPSPAAEWTIIHWSVAAIAVWAVFVTAQASAEKRKAHNGQYEK